MLFFLPQTRDILFGNLGSYSPLIKPHLIRDHQDTHGSSVEYRMESGINLLNTAISDCTNISGLSADIRTGEEHERYLQTFPDHMPVINPLQGNSR